MAPKPEDDQKVKETKCFDKKNKDEDTGQCAHYIYIAPHFNRRTGIAKDAF